LVHSRAARKVMRASKSKLSSGKRRQTHTAGTEEENVGTETI
jgi:hypothetical protein